MKYWRSSFSRALLIALAFCAVAPHPVWASASRDVMPNHLGVSLLRQDTHSGEAILRLSTTVNVTGCPKVHPLRHRVQIDGPYLDIIVEGYRLDLDNLPRAAHRECKQGIQYAAADIPLDRSLIKDNGIQQIRMVLDRGLGSDYYTVTLEKDFIEILPRSETVFKPSPAPYGGTLLKYWYYPKNTLVLMAPSAPEDQRADIIRRYAEQAKLVPLQHHLQSFIPPRGDKDRYYYVDKGGAVAAGIAPGAFVMLDGTVMARHPAGHE